MQAARSRVAQSIRVFRATLANADLRRVVLAFVGFSVTEYATWIAILVYAYEIGGATAVAIVGVVQLVPAAVVAPFVSLFGDRYRRDRTLTAGYVLQAAVMAAAAAVLFAGGSLPLVYAVAALAAMSITVTRPVQAALLPSLARTPEELTAANVAVDSIVSLSMFLGPAVTAVVLKVSGAGMVFAVMAAALLGSAALASRIAGQPAPSSAKPQSGPGGIADLLDGFRTLANEPGPRAVVGLFSAHFVVLGALDVLFVVLAFQLLDLGRSGVGLVSAAFGVGSILGSTMAILLAGRRRLAPPLLGSALTWGVTLGAVGLFPQRVAAPLLVAGAGAGRPLFDVASRTLLQRAVPDRVRARVFGVLEGLTTAAYAGGMALAPLLVAGLGSRAAFLVVGLFLPLLTLLAWRSLVALEGTVSVPLAQIAILRSIPIFAPLSAPVLERLAARLVPVETAAGSAIIREGERGDWFYVLVEGEVEVTIRGRLVDSHGPGGYFGEIALLRDIPRTATVVARTSARLYALDRDDFLEAVTGHPESIAAADEVVHARYDARSVGDGA